MSQNRSHAVMAQRAEPHDSLDDFLTPPWATRALIEYVLWPHAEVFAPDEYFRALSAWEPACNRGYMARPLKEYFGSVHCSDIHDYSDEWEGQDRVCDFLFKGLEPPHIAAQGVNWVISNPPFRLAEQFIERSFEVRGWQGTAMLVRTSFLEGVGRYENLFKRQPPSFVAQFAERVPMVKGRIDGEAPTATSYAWLVWMDGEEQTRLLWIPPCRKRLEREGDYECFTAA
jgi:hypothetical protein